MEAKGSADYESIELLATQLDEALSVDNNVQAYSIALKLYGNEVFDLKNRSLVGYLVVNIWRSLMRAKNWAYAQALLESFAEHRSFGALRAAQQGDYFELLATAYVYGGNEHLAVEYYELAIEKSGRQGGPMRNLILNTIVRFIQDQNSGGKIGRELSRFIVGLLQKNKRFEAIEFSEISLENQIRSLVSFGDFPTNRNRILW